MSDKETEIRERLDKAEHGGWVAPWRMCADLRDLLDENARLRAELAERDKEYMGLLRVVWVHAKSHGGALCISDATLSEFDPAIAVIQTSRDDITGGLVIQAMTEDKTHEDV